MKVIVNKIAETVHNSISSQIDLVDKVDSFYNNAWGKLIIVGAVAFGIIGIIVPFVIQWYQKRTLKVSEELLKKDIESKVSKMKSGILVELAPQIEQEFTKYEKKIKILNAKTFLIQGKLNLEKNYYHPALSNFIAASFSFIVSDDYHNLQHTLNLILKECLPYLSQEEITDLKISNDSNLDLLLKEIKESDDKGVFITIIQDIQLRITKLPITIKEKPQQKPK
jgi:hypothetical protein